MTKYDVTDEAIIQATPEQVYNAVIDCYDGKINWWMPYLTSKVIHGESASKTNAICKVTLNELIPIQFITKTTETFTNEIIYLVYPKGAFTGEGTWKFEKIDDKTKVSFRWQTNPSGFFMKMLSLFYPLNKSHSAVMQKGFTNLKKLLEHKS
jgi:ribosome-associated toxin RatA of RatAB toxin-antitoxin module